MAQDVIQLLFEGESSSLLDKYRQGVARYRETNDPAPEQIVVAQSAEGLMVTLVWGEGVSHENLGKFMLGVIGELGLPRPRATHGTLAAASWDALAERTGANA